jgi:peptidoglycan/LPS O-acetylase OafA/YrhL
MWFFVFVFWVALVVGIFWAYARRRLVRIAPPYWVALAAYGVLLPSLLRALAGIVHHTGELRWNGTEVTDQNTLRLWALAEHAISPRGGWGARLGGS